ncbi:MAG: class I SAM-dependent methyltransferase [Firmicutes bacterium]|nr:class I SAM-dependent methyltransferase [Bacillota bacterium]
MKKLIKKYLTNFACSVLGLSLVVSNVVAKTDTDDKWYEKVFDEFYIQIFEPLRTYEFTVNEVNQFIKHLNLKSGSKILDLGCGYGRHAIELTKSGYKVVGIDYSDILINKTMEDSKELDIQWIKSDMREIPFENEFDAVINNAFGYLENDEEELKVLKSIYKSLKPGGILLQWEIPNKICWARSFTTPITERISENNFLIHEREYDFETAKEFQKFSLVMPNQPIYERKFAVRIFDLNELKELYNKANLKYLRSCAFDGSEINFDTKEIMLLSQKPYNI